MKPSTVLIAAAVTGCAYGSSPAALLIPFDVNLPHSTSLSPSLSQNDARLLLAQRLGAADDVEIGGLEDDTVATLNQYGGSRRPLLGGNLRERRPPKLLMVLESMENIVEGWISRPKFEIAS